MIPKRYNSYRGAFWRTGYVPSIRCSKLLYKMYFGKKCKDKLSKEDRVKMSFLCQKKFKDISVEELCEIIVKNLYRGLLEKSNGRSAPGFCYVSCESLWHITGETDSDWKPRIKDCGRYFHWTLRNEKTKGVIDFFGDYTYGIYYS